MLKQSILVLFNFSCFAVNVANIKLSDGDRVGVFVGSFSPPHIRHQQIIEDVLYKANLDYIVVIANDTTPHKPDIVKLQHRINMLYELYFDHPNVLVMKDKSDFKYPRASSVIKELKRKANIDIIGITGHDSITKKLTKVGMKFLTMGLAGPNPYSQWLAVHTQNQDPFKIPNRMGRIPIIPINSPTTLDIHSSQIRHYLNGISKKPHPHLSPRVEAYAREHELYGPKNPSLFKKSCIALIQAIFRI